MQSNSKIDKVKSRSKVHFDYALDCYALITDWIRTEMRITENPQHLALEMLRIAISKVAKSENANR